MAALQQDDHLPFDASDDDEAAAADPYLTVREAPAGAGADIFMASRVGDTARLAAILTADPEAVGSRDVWSATALYYAALCGHLGAVQLLLEAGACVEGMFSGKGKHQRASLPSIPHSPPHLMPRPRSLVQNNQAPSRTSPASTASASTTPPCAATSGPPWPLQPPAPLP